MIRFIFLFQFSDYGLLLYAWARSFVLCGPENPGRSTLTAEVKGAVSFVAFVLCFFCFFIHCVRSYLSKSPFK
jgi:hypothetical protein